MASSILLFFIFLIHLLVVTKAQLSLELGDFCIDNYGNYTTNSPYKTNLDHVISSFSSLTTAQFNGGFYSFSAGKNPDRANAVGLCRGDLQPSDCFDCLHSLRIKLIKQCPNQKEAIGWYDTCMFRYSNRSIFGVFDNGTQILSSNDINATSPSDSSLFEEALSELVNKLSSRAASGGSVRKFATGNASAPGSQTIYALVQCTPDLSQLQCETCLAGAFNDVQVTFPGRAEVTAFLPNCHLRYANEKFNDSPSPSPSPVPPESPPLSTNDTQSKGNENRAYQSLVVSLVVAALAQLIVFVALF